MKNVKKIEKDTVRCTNKKYYLKTCKNQTFTKEQFFFKPFYNLAMRYGKT